jgi:hypothetical protein
MRATALNHEVFNHSMEVEPVIVSFADKLDEICHSVRGASVKEFDGDVSC